MQKGSYPHWHPVPKHWSKTTPLPCFLHPTPFVTPGITFYRQLDRLAYQFWTSDSL